MFVHVCRGACMRGGGAVVKLRCLSFLRMLSALFFEVGCPTDLQLDSWAELTPSEPQGSTQCNPSTGITSVHSTPNFLKGKKK